MLEYIERENVVKLGTQKMRIETASRMTGKLVSELLDEIFPKDQYKRVGKSTGLLYRNRINHEFRVIQLNFHSSEGIRTEYKIVISTRCGYPYFEVTDGFETQHQAESWLINHRELVNMTHLIGPKHW